MFKKTLLAMITISSLAAFSTSATSLTNLAQNINWDEDKDVKYCQLKLVKYESNPRSSSYHMLDIGSLKVLHFKDLSASLKPVIPLGRTVLSNCKMEGKNLIVEHSLRKDFLVSNDKIESVMDWTVIGNKDVDVYYDQPYDKEESAWYYLF
jgi:hypothetical protein